MPTGPPPPDLLTEGQRRHLTATLALVERAVRQVAALAGPEWRADGLLFQGQDDIPAARHDSIRVAATEVVVVLEELVVRFDLQPSSTSHRRTAEALLLSSLVEVEDTGSNSLRGYGVVHPDLAEHLDPLLDRLHHCIAVLRRVLTSS